jgi:hypothetical protein
MRAPSARPGNRVGWSCSFPRGTKQVIDLRNPTATIPTGEAPLASGGTLGGSQAGARLTWRYNSAFAANLRVSAPLRQGQSKLAGEAAGLVVAAPAERAGASDG